MRLEGLGARKGGAAAKRCKWGSGARQPLIGFSADALAASNPRRVGQGSKGLEGSLVDGMVPRKGSAKAPFHGLDEGVSMKWSGVSGAGTPLGRWVQGERSLPARDQPAIRLMAPEGLNALTEPQAGGMQRGRAAGPLAKMVLYYKTHLAVSPYGGLRALYYRGLLRRTKMRHVCTTAPSAGADNAGKTGLNLRP